MSTDFQVLWDDIYQIYKYHSTIPENQLAFKFLVFKANRRNCLTKKKKNKRKKHSVHIQSFSILVAIKYDSYISLEYFMTMDEQFPQKFFYIK